MPTNETCVDCGGPLNRVPGEWFTHCPACADRGLGLAGSPVPSGLASDYAWPQDAVGLIAMARDWVDLEGDDLFADDVLIHKLANALEEYRDVLRAIAGSDASGGAWCVAAAKRALGEPPSVDAVDPVDGISNAGPRA